MRMENQVTSIEQSKRLLDMGIPADKASMVWTTVDNYKAVVERDLCLSENIEGYAFTVDDLLGMLPFIMEYDGRLCELAFKKRSHGYGVEYDCPYDAFCVSFNFYNTAIDALEYAVEWFAKNKIMSQSRISNEQWIVEYLRGKGYTSPSEIGIAHKKAFNIDSPTHHIEWASPICNRMVEKGILIRNNKGQYKLIKP